MLYDWDAIKKCSQFTNRLAVMLVKEYTLSRHQDNPQKNIPMQITLEQNFPNPFNPETVIGFYLPEETHITLKVYNLLGQIVTTLYEGQKSVGSHTAVWNGNNDMGQRMSTGIYLIQLMADNHLLTRKISLIR